MLHLQSKIDPMQPSTRKVTHITLPASGKIVHITTNEPDNNESGEIMLRIDTQAAYDNSRHLQKIHRTLFKLKEVNLDGRQVSYEDSNFIGGFFVIYVTIPTC